MTENQYIPDTVSPPGETLAELLEERGISQVQLSKQLGLHRKTINEILQGKSVLTSDTALQLEHVLHVPAEFWVRREADYRAHLARKRETAELKTQAVHTLKGIPYRAMQRAGWIDATPDRVQILRELLRFFRVGTLQQLTPESLLAGAAFRRPMKLESDPLALAAWLRRGEVLAERAETPTYDRVAFEHALERVRAFTVHETAVALQEAKVECAQAGVLLLIVPGLKGACVSGAARWVLGRPVIQLSLRHRSDDDVWFTFFHEAGHILMHGEGAQFLDEDRGAPTNSKDLEADRFAADHLVSSQAWSSFVNAGPFSEAAVVRFAGHVGIAPAIVVGRLQHEKRLRHTQLNHLKGMVQPGECLDA